MSEARVEAAARALERAQGQPMSFGAMARIALAAADEAEPMVPENASLLKKHAEWVWKRCPGCGRYSKYQEPPDWEQTKKEHPDWTWSGDFHSDGCPLEGLYSHTHQWWFERELEAKAEAADRAERAARELAGFVRSFIDSGGDGTLDDAEALLAAHPEYSQESGT